jgi:hypothetical protein
VGNFTLYNGFVANRELIDYYQRALDTSFVGSGADGIVEAVLLQSDGKIVIEGVSNFNGSSCNRLARLNADGSLDTSFFLLVLVLIKRLCVQFSLTIS